MKIEGINNFTRVNNNKEIELQKAPQGYHQDNQTGMVLPDIRSNQVLLPDNKIYIPSNKPQASFNRNNISVELPKNYQEISRQEENKFAKMIRQAYKTSDVRQYKNTQTGADIVRATKNVFSPEGILDSSEVLEIDLNNNRKGTKYIKDFEHNSETEIKLSNPHKPRRIVLDSMTTIHKDKNGNVVKTEEYTKSQIDGIYDITETDALGNKTVVSKTTKDENGNIKIIKNLKSLDGTTTAYRFESDAEGNHKKLFSQITDKDGKVLSTIDRTYDKEGNITYSSVNGNKYKAEKKPDGIEITDYAKDKITYIKTKDKEASDEDKLLIQLMMMQRGRSRDISNENVVDKLFETLPADTLLTLNDNIKAIIPLEDDLDSAFMSVFDYLMCKTDNFVINHELGHSKDANRVPEDTNLIGPDAKNLTKNVIADKSNFRKAYVEEKAAFVKEFPDFGEKFISYFINSPETKKDRGRKETVAESNAINGLKPEPPKVLAMRTTLLQRYFPRSIAELTKMMNPIALGEENQEAQQK